MYVEKESDLTMNDVDPFEYMSKLIIQSIIFFIGHILADNTLGLLTLVVDDAATLFHLLKLP